MYEYFFLHYAISSTSKCKQDIIDLSKHVTWTSPVSAFTMYEYVCGAVVHCVQRKFRYGNVCVCVWGYRCTMCTEEVQVQQCVCVCRCTFCTEEVQVWQCVYVQMYFSYRGNSGTAMRVCVWCTWTVCR